MAADWRRLSLRIWGRQPDRPLGFRFDALQGLQLHGLPAEPGEAAGPADGKAVSGMAWVDDGNRFVFLGPGADAGFLRELAAWARAHVRQVPALAALMDAGAAAVPEAAAAAGEVAAEAILRDPALWDELLPANAATVAELLESLWPGTRLWAWIDPTARGDEVPVLVHALADDPDHHRMDALVDALVGIDDPGWSGTGRVLEDGRIQLVGRGLGHQHLQVVARWVAASVAAHPGLGRLKDLQLACLAEDGSVAAIEEDAALWAAVPALPAPGTLAGSAAALQRLEAGAALLGWLSPEGAAEPTLILFPDEQAWDTAAEGLAARFPGEFERGHALSVEGLAEGGLAVACLDEDAAGFAPALQALIDRHGADFPALASLAAA